MKSLQIILIGFVLLVLGVMMFLRGAFGFNFGQMAVGIVLGILAIGMFIGAIVAGI